MNIPDPIRAAGAHSAGPAAVTDDGFTATSRGTGAPTTRDALAAHLSDRAEVLTALGLDPYADAPAVTLQGPRAAVVAELLDELDAGYRGEQLGRLAREVAVALYDQLGV